MKKIMTVIGARPQFIKAATVSRLIRESDSLNEVLVHTGQHYDTNMSDIFFEELDIPKIDYHLGIGSGTHGKQTGEMMAALEAILIKEHPDYLLIYGDTNSTLAAALAASKLHIPVAHVEAGLRSYNRKMPEEINRIVADQLSNVLFTPTKQAGENLKKEGFDPSSIKHIGDVMYDAALFFAEKAQSHSKILKTHHLDKYILATIHRAENTDDPKRLNTIFKALNDIAEQHTIVIPLHPRTRKMLDPKVIANTKIKLIDPVGFLDMVMLEKNALLIITDSGGVQKEAFFYQVPCITLRDETEWVETVELGWNTILKPDSVENIKKVVMSKIGSKGQPNQYPYGKGNAALQITQYFDKGQYENLDN